MKRISKNQKIFLWNAIGTTINSFLSLFFLIVVTRINGIDESGLFSFYYSLSFTLQAISNYGGRIYQVSDINNEFSFNNYLSSRYLTSMITIIILFSYCFIKQVSISAFSIASFLILSRIIETFSDVIYASFQKNDFLDLVGKSYFIKSVVTFILFLMIDLITHNLVIATSGILIGTVITFFIYDLRKIKSFESIHHSFCFDVLKKSKYIFYFSFVTLFITSIPRFVGNEVLSKTEIGYLGIIMMIPTVMGLLGQFIIQPKLIDLTKYCKQKNMKEFYKIILNICKIMFVLSIILCLCAYICGPFVLGILYNISFENYRIMFCILIIAGTFNCLSNVFSNTLTILRKTKVQLYIYIAILIICIILSIIFSNLFKIQGLLISYMITMLIQLIIFIVIVKKERVV